MDHGASKRTKVGRLAEDTKMRILSIEASTDPFGRLDFQEPSGRLLRWEANMRLDVNPEEADLLRILLEKDIGETRVEVHHAKNIEFKAHLQAREKVLQVLIDRFKTNT